MLLDTYNDPSDSAWLPRTWRHPDRWWAILRDGREVLEKGAGLLVLRLVVLLLLLLLSRWRQHWRIVPTCWSTNNLRWEYVWLVAVFYTCTSCCNHTECSFT
jgi:hypothetical protein